MTTLKTAVKQTRKSHVKETHSDKLKEKNIIDYLIASFYFAVSQNNGCLFSYIYLVDIKPRHMTIKFKLTLSDTFRLNKIT